MAFVERGAARRAAAPRCASRPSGKGRRRPVITASQIRELRESLGASSSPALSLYVAVDPSDRTVGLTRVRSTLRDLEGLPKPVADRVIAAVEAELTGRTIAVFADHDDVRVVPLQVDLPIVDETTGRVEARWGDVYLAPLLLALDEHERYGIVYVDHERWRLFEVFLGEIEEIASGHRATAPGEHDVLGASKQVHPAYVAARDGSAADDARKHRDEQTRRMHRNAGTEIDRYSSSRGFDRIVLMGPGDATAMLEAQLPRSSRNRIEERIAGPSSPEAAVGEFLVRVGRVIRDVESRREAELLDEVREQGVRGLRDTLKALQNGRVYVVVAPWKLEREVYVSGDPVMWIAAERNALEDADGNGVRSESLRAVLPELVERYGARVELVRGPVRQRLLEEMGGLGGLVRW